MSSILLTGGTGLVGRDLLRHLLAENHRVYLLTRSRCDLTKKNLVCIPVDLGFPGNGFFTRLPDVDMVVHAAAAVHAPDPLAAFQNYRSVNMQFSENLFRWCASAKKISAVVYLSTLSSLLKPLQDPITESHPLAPLTLYAMSKYWAEEALLQHAACGGFRPVIFRLSSPIAFNLDHLHDTVVKKWIIQARAQGTISVFGTGDRSQDFIATPDIARAVYGALTCEKAAGIYNLASGSTLSMSALAAAIAQRFPCSIAYSGEDPNDNDRWNIAIAKAGHDIGFRPQYSSAQTIQKLLDSIL